MGTIRTIVISLAIMLLVLPALVFAQDELFDTNAAAAHVEKGLVLLKANKHDTAIVEFEKAVDIYPDAEAYYYLGYTYYLKGKKNDAPSMKKSRENFDKAYEIDPEFAPGKSRTVETIPPGTEIKAVESRSPPTATPTPTPPAPIMSAPTSSEPLLQAKPQEPMEPQAPPASE